MDQGDPCLVVPRDPDRYLLTRSIYSFHLCLLSGLLSLDNRCVIGSSKITQETVQLISASSEDYRLH